MLCWQCHSMPHCHAAQVMYMVKLESAQCLQATQRTSVGHRALVASCLQEKILLWAWAVCSKGLPIAGQANRLKCTSGSPEPLCTLKMAWDVKITHAPRPQHHCKITQTCCSDQHNGVSSISISQALLGLQAELPEWLHNPVQLSRCGHHGVFHTATIHKPKYR